MTNAFLKSIAIQQGYADQAVRAGEEAYLRKYRRSHPRGSFDKAKRFHLHERLDCCCDIRTPSRGYPYSQLQHGRSAEHVARLFGVETLHVKRLVKAIEAMPSDIESLSAHEKLQLVPMIMGILKPV